MSRLMVACLCGIFLLALALPGSSSRFCLSGQDLDCSECHTCDHPSATNPCLKRTICPRHEQMAALEADLGPSVVILQELEKLYAPVRFDHKAHAQMVRLAGGCETCHHFTPPNAEHPACKDCHPKEILHEDIAQPGLKGAYHRNCMSCHREWDKDTACEICHARKRAGQPEPSVALAHSHYEPIELQELIVFDTAHDGGDRVPFHHRNHSELYERDCGECHQQQSCQRCHVHGVTLHPMGEPAEIDLHETCFNCHREERCGDCHGRDPNDLFTHASTGWQLKSYHETLSCCACHTKKGAFLKLDPTCEKCHVQGWDPETFDHGLTGVRLDEIHREADCGDCHTCGVGSLPTCEMCHDDARTYRSAGFPD